MKKKCNIILPLLLPHILSSQDNHSGKCIPQTSNQFFECLKHPMHLKRKRLPMIGMQRTCDRQSLSWKCPIWQEVLCHLVICSVQTFLRQFSRWPHSSFSVGKRLPVKRIPETFRACFQLLKRPIWPEH